MHSVHFCLQIVESAEVDFLNVQKTVDLNRPIVATSSDRTTLSRSAQLFVLWALETLEVEYQQLDRLTYLVTIPAEDRGAVGVETVSFAVDEGEDTSPATDKFPVDLPLISWLVDQLRGLPDVQHAVPTGQPAGVHQIARQILGAYEVKGGSVHLSGCTLEERPFLRVSHQVSRDQSSISVHQRFFDLEGREVDRALVDALGLRNIKPAGGVPRLPVAELQRWLAVVQSQEQPAAGERIVATLIWCKYAQVKITFVIGESTAEQTFAGWAQRIGDGTQKPPPFVCPATGIKSFRLEQTDDGRITVAEALAVCGETKRRVLISELETCSVTGVKAAANELAMCPVSEQPVLSRLMSRCAMCGQLVSPASINNNQCAACQALKPVRKDDPRMARVLGEYPKLDEWSRWRFAETAGSYIMVASTMVKRLLVVVEKDSLEPLRIAVSSRFSAQWSEAPLAERDHYLRNAT